LLKVVDWSSFGEFAKGSRIEIAFSQRIQYPSLEFMSIQIGIRLGPYEIVSHLGAGGMGEVWRAKDTRLDREVAIKALPAGFAANNLFRQRFEREAKAISQLNHPNICTLYDVGHIETDADGSGLSSDAKSTLHYIVMELLEGEPLSDRLKKGPLPTHEVLRYGREIASALDAAHRRGIIHRDLKPGNIMLTKSGAKLVDFGLARTETNTKSQPDGVTHLPTAAEPLTQEGTILGTFQYMAPEQLEGMEADARTDIFALGAVLYEMATGKRAFQGHSKTSLIAAIVSSQPEPISSVSPLTPPALDHIVQKCLEKDPDSRWQSAYDVASELQWMSEVGSQAGVARVTADLRRSKMRMIRVVAVAGWIFALGFLAWIILNKNEVKMLQRPIRAEIVPPVNVTISGVGAGSISISQDGSKIVIPTFAELFTRNLESGETRQLEGTTGAIFPFWSFDGESIGFFADGKLKRIPANGGPIQVIEDAPQGRGGTWGRDDTIVFAPNIFGPLMKVPASGGQPAPVTSVLEQGMSDRNPYLLPDGKHLLFTRSTVSKNGSIAISSINRSKEKIVMDRGSNPQYAEGYLFWTRDKNLLAQPFNPDSGKLSGEPTPIAANVEYFGPRDIGNFSVSSGGTLVWRNSNPVPLQLVEMDRQGHEIQAIGEPGEYNLMDVDRSGHEALLVKTEPSGVSDLWIMDLTRAQVRRATFTSAPQGSIYGVFSPDGANLAVSVSSFGTKSLSIVSTTASSPQKVPTQTSFLVTYWSGAKTLVGMMQDASTRYDIAYLSIDDPSKVLKFAATPSEELFPRLSPDGKWITWTSDESGQSEIYLSDFPAATRKWQISKRDARSFAHWAPERNGIYYARKDNKSIVYTPVSIGKNGLQLGSPEIIAMDPSSSDSEFFVIPDDKFLTMKAVFTGHIEPIHILRNWKSVLPK
jgi:serine/threonine protein kinase/Tol biopolymer transport system component